MPRAGLAVAVAKGACARESAANLGLGAALIKKALRLGLHHTALKAAAERVMAGDWWGASVEWRREHRVGQRVGQGHTLAANSSKPWLASSAAAGSTAPGIHALVAAVSAAAATTAALWPAFEEPRALASTLTRRSCRGVAPGNPNGL